MSRVLVTPSEAYQLGDQAYRLFPHWLAQQHLPDEATGDALEDLLRSAFIAGYMRDHSS
jgi:hypothetical protein